MIKNKFDIVAAYKLYTENNYSNISQAAKDYCDSVKVEYSDSYRRNLSNYIRRVGEGVLFNVGDKHSAKVLVFDIETAPLSSYVWGIWNQNIGTNMDMIQSEWFILTWSAKWLFSDEIISAKLTSQEAIEEDDSRIVKDLWDIVNEADVLIAHNGKKFDIKKINTRFLLNGLPKPLPYQVIDTLIHARKELSITSNKLDYLGKVLGVGKKVEHEGFSLWKKSVKGDSQALDKMSEYNNGDITLLEEVYLALRPYINPHPNFGFHVENNVESCPTCGSEDLQWNTDIGVYRTYVNEYQTCRCNSCGSISRSRKPITKSSIRDRLLVSLPV